MRDVSKRNIITLLVNEESQTVKYDIKTTILVDESDNQYVDRQNQFEAGLVVGLTATPLAMMESNEKVLLM